MMRPILDSQGVYHGALPSTQESIDYAYDEMSAPTAGLLAEIKINTVSIEHPSPKTVIAAMPEPLIDCHNDFAAYTMQGSRVDISANAVLVDNNWNIKEQHNAGIKSEALMLTQSQIRWESYSNEDGPVCCLAPAFAAIASTWLDRSAISAITTALSWVGPMRGPEIDPQTRSAMRSGANRPIELTRFYVRLWAMLFSGHIARCDKKRYAPRPIRDTRHFMFTANNFSAWASALNTASFGNEAPIYFDAQGSYASQDILPILEVMCADQLVDAGVASWLWPPIHGARVYTNKPYSSVVNIELDPNTCLAAITWLQHQTATERQCAEAFELVNHLVMRPAGWGIFGSSATDATALIRLPNVSTAGQMLAPFALVNSTIAESPQVILNNVIGRQMLSAAARAGVEYCYAISQACANLITPSWWDKQAAYSNSIKEYHATTTIGQHWYPAVLAAHQRHAIRGQFSSKYLLTMRPNNLRHTARIANAISGGCMWQLPWSPNVLASDTHSALFAKFSIDNNAIRLPLNQPIAINLISQRLNTNHTTELLQSAGGKIGYIISKRTTGLNVAYIEARLQNHAQARFPIAHNPNIGYTPVVEFTKAAQLFDVLQIATRRTNGKWYIQTTAMRDMADMLTHEPGEPHPHIGPPSHTNDLGPNDMIDTTTSEQESDGPYDEQQSAADTEPTPVVPKVILEHKDDAVLAHIAASAMAPTHLLPPPPSSALKSWKPPRNIIDDPDALRWLATMIQPAFSADTKHDNFRFAEAQTAVLTELIRLQEARRTVAEIGRAPSDTNLGKSAQHSSQAPPPVSAAGTMAVGAVYSSGPAAAPEQQASQETGPYLMTAPAINVRDLPKLTLTSSD
jgi:hypothetical protein